MVPRDRFELSYTVPKTVVLPLDDLGKLNRAEPIARFPKESTYWSVLTYSLGFGAPPQFSRLVGLGL